MFRQLTVIGVGLIGGSLARALRQVSACDEIVGTGRDQQHLQQALDLGVIDRFELDIGKAVAGADMVVVAVPLAAMAGVFSAMRPHLAADAIVTDVGSAKVAVIEAARLGLGERLSAFVPGHPIAGTEQSGVAASFAGLFEDRRVILTPLPENASVSVDRVRKLWSLCGAKVVNMDAAHHDEVLAATSHLPHLLAYALVDTLVRLDDSEEIFTYAAGGFRDFSRIASSDPLMWRDICLANRDAILKQLDHFSQGIETLTNAIRAGDGEQIMKLFSRAKAARDRIK
jgi:prephenate dehydrogenase